MFLNLEIQLDIFGLLNMGMFFITLTVAIASFLQRERDRLSLPIALTALAAAFYHLINALPLILEDTFRSSLLLTAICVRNVALLAVELGVLWVGVLAFRHKDA